MDRLARRVGMGMVPSPIWNRMYRLSHRLIFPDPRLAGPEGLVAVGGDLRAARLLLAYRNGIFPWPHHGYPLLWFSPDPRLLLLPGGFHVSRSLRRSVRRLPWRLRMDTAFERVMRACATVPRPGQPGTWITADMLRAYTNLHRMGFAHSMEVWLDGALVGGVYGLSIGRAFFGESMFHRQTDASKIALGALHLQITRWGFHFLDCQLPTPHLVSLGGAEMSRDAFLGRLAVAVGGSTRLGRWETDDDILGSMTA